MAGEFQLLDAAGKFLLAPGGEFAVHADCCCGGWTPPTDPCYDCSTDAGGASVVASAGGCCGEAGGGYSFDSYAQDILCSSGYRCRWQWRRATTGGGFTQLDIIVNCALDWVAYCGGHYRAGGDSYCFFYWNLADDAPEDISALVGCNGVTGLLEGTFTLYGSSLAAGSGCDHECNCSGETVTVTVGP